MKYKQIFLDLDGTLSDSKKGIIDSAIAALKDFNIVATPDDFTQFIGPPLRESFIKTFGFSDSNVNEIIKKYREYYVNNGIYQSDLYAGITEMLERLHMSGKELLLATSKEEESAIHILNRTGVKPFFKYIGGASLEKSRLTKYEVLQYVCETCNISDTKNCIMVGDREHDVKGAHTLGISCIGVLYGYGSRAELEDAGVNTIVDSVKELENILSE